jgi:hypothetical protein
MHGFDYSTPPHQMTGAFWAGGKKTSPEVKKKISLKKITHKLQASSRVGPPHNEQASSS